MTAQASPETTGQASLDDPGPTEFGDAVDD